MNACIPEFNQSGKAMQENWAASGFWISLSLSRPASRVVGRHAELYCYSQNCDHQELLQSTKWIWTGSVKYLFSLIFFCLSVFFAEHIPLAIPKPIFPSSIYGAIFFFFLFLCFAFLAQVMKSNIQERHFYLT